jgi:hypothetical protein
VLPLATLKMKGSVLLPAERCRWLTTLDDFRNWFVREAA